MQDRIAYQGITFDDVLLDPGYSDVLPRDCDVRVIVADHEFAARFGHEVKPTEKPGWTHCIAWDEDGPSQRWIDDCAKTGAEWSVRLGLNVDYKVWPLSYWRERVYPEPVLLAAPSPTWFVYSAIVPDPSGRAASRGAEPASGGSAERGA